MLSSVPRKPYDADLIEPFETAQRGSAPIRAAVMDEDDLEEIEGVSGGCRADRRERADLVDKGLDGPLASVDGDYNGDGPWSIGSSCPIRHVRALPALRSSRALL